MTLSEVSGELAAGCYAARSRRLARAVSRIYDQHLRPLGLKASQQAVLVVVAEGFERPVDIGVALDMEKSTVARAVAVMESNGWVGVSTEGSGRQVVLTEAGEKLLMASLKPWRLATEEIAGRLRSEDDLLPYLVEAEPDAVALAGGA